MVRAKREKSQGKKGKKENHEYYLVMEGNQSAYYEKEVVINFGPKRISKKKPIKTCYPVFNRDHKYFTPAFSLSKSIDNENLYYENHHKKQSTALKLIESEQQQQIYVPKPSRRHDYCGVCRKGYDEYLEHINSDHHKSKIEKSVWQKEIAKVCRNLTQKEEKKEEESNNQLTAVNKVTQKVVQI